MKKLRKLQETTDKEDSIPSQMWMANPEDPSALKSVIKTRMLNQPSDIQVLFLFAFETGSP